MADRTVKVKLVGTAEHRGYDRGTAAMIAETKALEHEIDGLDRKSVPVMAGLGDAADKTGHDFAGAGRSVGEFGDNAETATTQGAHLEREIARLTQRVKDVRLEVDRTGKFELLTEKSFRDDTRRLALLKRSVEALAAETAAVSAVGVASEITRSAESSFDGLTQNLRGKAIAAGVALGAIAAPYIGAAIGGAVTAAVGLVGVGGGIALAAKDPRVRVAARALGHQVAEDMFAAAKPFAEPTAAGLTTLRDTWAEIAPDITKSMHELSGAVEPLADGLGGFTKRLTPGLTHALDKGAQLVGVFADELPELGDHLGDMFSAMADGEGNVEGLRDTMEGLGNVLEGVGHVVGFLSDAYARLKDVQDFVPDPVEQLLQQVANPLHAVGDAFNVLNGNADKADGTVVKVAGHLNLAARAAGDAQTATFGLGRAIGGAVGEVQTAADTFGLLTEGIDAYIRKTMEMDDANIAWQQSLDDLSEELGDGKRTLDINSQAGRDNATAILDAVTAAERLRQDMIQKTPGAVAAANKAYQDNIDKIYEMGRKAGFSKTQLDKLVGKYRIDIDVAIHNISQGLSNALKPLKNLGFAEGGYPPMTGEAFTVGEQGTELMGMQGGRLRVLSTPQTRHMFSPPAAAPSAVAWRGAAGGVQTVRHEHLVTLQWPDGRVIRKLSITDAVDRGVPQSAIAAAHP